MDETTRVVLVAECRAQLRQIKGVFCRVESRAREQGQAGLESLGFQLHNLYCACEELFEIVAAAFENHVDSNGGYHIELLKRMRMDIPGVRPREISDEAFGRLETLRSFRHVFRHAYGASLDERKLAIVLEDARELMRVFPDELEAFLAAIYA